MCLKNQTIPYFIHNSILMSDKMKSVVRSSLSAESGGDVSDVKSTPKVAPLDSRYVESRVYEEIKADEGTHVEAGTFVESLVNQYLQSRHSGCMKRFSNPREPGAVSTLFRGASSISPRPRAEKDHG